MRPRKLIVPLIVIAAGAFAAYQARFAPVRVETVAVVRRTAEREVAGVGTLAAPTRITVSPKIQGRIVELLVDQNDPVEEGRILARLDDSDLREQVAMAEASHAMAVAARERVKADVVRAAAVLNLARIEHERSTALEPKKILARQEFDKSLEQFHIAEAEKARAETLAIETDRGIDVAARTLDFQRARLADTVLRAPFPGVIVRRDRSAGDVVVPGAGIFELVSTGEIWVSAWVGESDFARVAPGQPARVTFRSEPDRPFPGSVVRTSHEMDRETREFLVDIRLDRLPERWAIGQRADVHIVVERRDAALVVPARLLRWNGGTLGVYLARGGRIAWQDLAPAWTGDSVAVVDAGLAEGERVIVPPPGAGSPPQIGRRIGTER